MGWGPSPSSWRGSFFCTIPNQKLCDDLERAACLFNCYRLQHEVVIELFSSFSYSSIVGRIMGIDYGKKNCGIAVTDPLQLIVSPLRTVKTTSLISFLEVYFREEEVDKIVFGMPSHFDGSPTYLVKMIQDEVKRVKLKFESLAIDYQNENWSSKQAQEIILKSGLTKKQRQDKTRLDKISAVIILQRYLKHI